MGLNDFTVGANAMNPLFNIVLNYPRYQSVISNERTVRMLNAEQRDKLQEFVKNHTVIVPVRVCKKQTSVKIRTCIAALHAFITAGETIKDYKQYLLDNVNRISQKWYGEDGKGLSGFVQDTLIRECLDSSEKKRFDMIVGLLNAECASVGSSKVYSNFDPYNCSPRE